jgi:hypothetical protein
MFSVMVRFSLVVLALRTTLRRGSCALGVGALVALASASPAAAFRFGSTVTPTGPEQTVFDWQSVPQPPPPPSPPQCSDEQFFEDSPARAFKDSQNRVQLIMSHAGFPTTTTGHTRRLMTPPGGSLANLGSLSVDCTVIHSSHANSLPESYDNAEWLVSPYTEDGQTIYGLVHNEYHGYEYGRCSGSGFPPDKPPQCWYNSITLAKSTDGGQSYTHATAPSHRIATSPYIYEQDVEAYGYFQPTNIVKKDGWYYAMIRAAAHGAQKKGECVMRTQNLDSPTSWRAWDGTGFNVSFMDAYRDTSAPEAHVCEPVSPDPTGAAPDSAFKAGTLTGDLVYSNYYDAYMLIGDAFKPENGHVTAGFYYSLSKDLIHWTERQLIFEAELTYTHQCGDEDPVAHPSVIDSSSTDRNFGTVGQTADLYFVRLHYANNGCDQTRDRDLVRIPVRFQFKPTARWATGPFWGCPSAFDSASYNSPQSYFFPSADRNYNGTINSYKADTTPGGSVAYGIFDKNGDPPGPLCEFNNESGRVPLAFGEGDDIWYSGAFVFPNPVIDQTSGQPKPGTGGFWDKLGSDPNASVAFLKLDPAPAHASWAGMFTADRNARVRFSIYDGSGDQVNGKTQVLGNQGVPIAKDNCWHFFEVHQKFSSTSGQALTEVWIDRPINNAQPTGSSTARNYFGSPYRTIRAGIVGKAGTGNNSLLYTDMDGLYLSGYPLAYSGCTGIQDNFPG